MDANTTSALASVDMGFVRGVITALTMACFAGIAFWAYHRGNRERFERDALLVFTEDELPAADRSIEAAAVQEGEER